MMNIDIRLNDFVLPINVVQDSDYYRDLCKMPYTMPFVMFIELF